MTTNPPKIETAASLDELFEMLSHSSRRRILFTLAISNPRAEEEFQTESFASDDDDLEDLLIQLTHLHLPKLAESEFINWDRETNTITRGSHFEEVQPLLTLMQEHQDELPDD